MMTANEVLLRLKEGNHEFVKNKLQEVVADPDVMTDLVSGQSPYAIILCCAYSRVVPAYYHLNSGNVEFN